MPNPHDLLRQAEERLRRGDAPGGAGLLSDFLKRHPDDPRAAHARARLAEVQLGRGLLDDAEQLFERARKDLGDSPHLLYRLAQVHAVRGRTDTAFDLLDRVLALEPDHTGAIARRAALLQHLGRHDEAAAIIDDAYARGLADHNLAYMFAGIAMAVGRRAEAIERLAPYAADSSLPAPARAATHFILGRMLEAQAEYDRAWECFEAANRLVRPRIDISELDRVTAQTIEAFPREVIASLERAPDSADRAVLIVGMPRSGTTLVEQILAAHPHIAPGGELSALPKAVDSVPGNRPPGRLPPIARLRGNALKRANQHYLDALHHVSADAARVTDKLPTNYRFLGLVPSVLPGARVIHCTRDPLDTCVSCFCRNFSGPNVVLSDLDWIARVYLDYARLMRHWESALEGRIEMARAEYADMVTDLEPNARRLVGFVGLPFDDACLRFDQQRRITPTLEPEQAGRNVYDSSIGRWKHYEKHLGPLIKALGPELTRG